MKAPVVCSIGTSDPWNAAGIGLDSRALAELGMRAVTVVAGVSAQDAEGIHEAAPVPEGLVRAQLESLALAGISAFRIGALLDAECARVVAQHLFAMRLPSVYDPVLGASAGGRFADAALLAILRDELGPQTTLFTPNLREACEFAEIDVVVDANEALQRDLAQRLRERMGCAVLVTGGDRHGDPVDVLADGRETTAFRGERIAGGMRGTGCLLACAAAAALARGAGLREAVEFARAFVRRKLQGAVEFAGMRVAYE